MTGALKYEAENFADLISFDEILEDSKLGFVYHLRLITLPKFLV